jgi:hypothetical protein
VDRIGIYLFSFLFFFLSKKILLIRFL